MNENTLTNPATALRLPPTLQQREVMDAPQPIRLVLRLPETVDAIRLQSALDQVVAAHEGLRMAFSADSSAMEVHPGCRHQLVAANPQDAAHDQVTPQNPWRFIWEGDRHLLVMQGHAAVTDSLALCSLAVELERALLGNAASEPPLQFSQYADWQVNMQDEPESEQGRHHWKAQPVPARLQTPLQHPGKGGWDCAVLDLGDRADWQAAFAQVEASTGRLLPDIALAAWATVLARLQGASEVALGWYAHGREYDEFRGIQGPFARCLPVKVRIEEATKILDCLQQVEWARLEAEGHQLFGSPEGMADAALSIVEVAANDLQPGGFTIEALQSMRHPHSICLQILKVGGQMRPQILYNGQEWTSAAAECLGKMLTASVTGFAKSPQSLAMGLPLLESEAIPEWIRLYADSGEAALDYLPLVPEIFQTSRLGEPVVFSRSGVHLTYGDLEDLTNRLAGYLRDAGIGQGDVVAVLLDRSVNAMIAPLAAWKCGAAYLPIQADLPKARLDFILRDASPRMLVTDSFRLLEVEGYEGQLFAADVQMGMLPEAPSFAAHPNAADDLAYLIYTSGTTGQPKACLQTHGNLSQYLHWASGRYFDGTEQGDFPLFTALSFDLTLTSMFLPLLRGRRVWVHDIDEPVEETLRQVFATGAADTVKLTPAHVRVIAALGITSTPVQRLVLGGEALLPWHVATLRKMNPGIRIFNEYGPTETTVGCMCWEAPEALEEVMIGRPISGARIYILDGAGNPCPPGLAGELCIAGPGVGQGYLDQPELTRRKFVADPFAPGTMYRSGDVGYYGLDREVRYSGRADDQLKVNGYRVEAEDIAAVLLRQPGIRDAVVVGWRREPSVESVELVAYLVGPADIDGSALRQLLASELPAYMIPAHFLVLPALPLTSNGKVDRKALPDPQPLIAKERAFLAPASGMELALAEAWSEVLGGYRVGASDNFFQLGGDSIKAIQVASRLRGRGIHLEVKDILAHPVLAAQAEQARFLDDGRSGGFQAVAGPFALLPLQQDLLERDPALAHHYNQAVRLTSRTPVDEAAFRSALQSAMDRHPALRLRLLEAEAGWMQDVADHAVARMQVVDLREATDARAVMSETVARLQGSMLLEGGNLLQSVLFHSADADEIVLIAHHFAVDAISWRILLEGLVQDYAARQAGAAGLPIQQATGLAEYAVALEHHANGAMILEELPYWVQAASRMVPALRIEQVGGSGKFRDVADLNHKLEQELTLALMQDVHMAYNTQVLDLLLVALGLGLRDWQGWEAFPVWMDGHGRNGSFPGPDIGGCMGWFTAEFPFWLETGPGTDLGQVIRQVKDALRQVPDSGIGYGALRRMAGAERRAQLPAAFAPLVSFNFLGDMDSAVSLHGFELSPEPVPGCLHPDAAVPVPLAFTAIILHGRFQIAVNYDARSFSQDTMARLLDGFLGYLRELILHCQGVLSPKLSNSDIDFQGFDIAGLDEFINSL